MKKIDRNLFQNEVSKHRKEDCKHYQSCLREAALCDWSSFSCFSCSSYSPVKKDLVRNLKGPSSSLSDSWSLKEILEAMHG